MTARPGRKDPPPRQGAVPPGDRAGEASTAPTVAAGPRSARGSAADGEHPTYVDAGRPDGSSPAEASGLGPRLGPYAVVGQLGRGGMGEVLRVRDLQLGREMAAKVMLDHSDPWQLEKFLLEARITGQLEHPAIVPVHQLGHTSDGRAFFTMKQVQGEDLARVLDRLREDPDASPRLIERLAIFGKVCDATAFAHARGVIHRDLKPANVMVGEFGEVQVMDWGLAKELASADLRGVGESGNAAFHDERPLATQDGTILGTPTYMPPEQALGRIAELDHRADVYALGAMLYHLLALVPPYSGQSVWEVIAQVTDGDLVPPHLRAPQLGVPWELSAVVVKAMASDPAARYESVSALAADVRAYLGGGVLAAARYTAPQLAAKWVGRHRTACLAAFVLALASLGWSGHAAWRRRTERRAEVASALAAARALLEKHPYVAPTPPPAAGTDEAPEVDVVETLSERTERDASIEARISAASAIDRALARDPNDAVALALRARVDHELGRLALSGRDYGLAAQAFGHLARLGLGETEVGKLLAAVEAARTARHRRIERRLRLILEDVGAGLKRPGRSPQAPDLDDHVFEAAGYREHATVRLLSAALEPLIERGRTAGRDVVWTLADEDLARFVCRVLGRLRLVDSVPALARWMEVVWHPDLALEVGRALVRLPGSAGHAAARAACDRLGHLSSFGRELLPRLALVAPPRVEAPAGDATPMDVARAVGMLLMEHRPDEAMRRIEAAIALRPEWETALLVMRAVTKLDLQDRDGAQRDLEAHLLREPGDPAALRARGHILKERGDYAGAEADLRRSVEAQPYAGAYRDLAEIAYIERGDHDAAIRALDEAVRLAPNDGEILALRGLVRAGQGRTSEALADLDRGVRLNSRSAQCLAWRGAGRLALGQVSLGIVDLNRSLELEPDNFFGRTNRALALASVGELDGALADARRAVELEPGFANAHRTLASVLASRGELEPALAAAKRALSLNPRHLAARRLSAQVREALGDAAGAIAEWDRIEGIAPGELTIYPARARLYRARGDYERALSDHARSIELTRGEERLGAMLARALTQLERGAFSEASAECAAILADSPDHVLAAAASALTAAAQGRTAEARAALDAVRRRDSGAYWPLWVAALGGSPAVLDALASADTWPAPVARVLRGDLALEACVRELELLPPAVRRRRRCELEAFVGAAHDSAGRIAVARAAYERAVAQGAPDSWQYSWSVVRLTAFGR